MSEKLQQFSLLRKARRCFPKGKAGKEQIREILENSIRTPEELVSLRSEFALGISGQDAFLVIAFGNPCERSLGDDKNSNYKSCGKEAKITIDVDVSGGKEDHIPVCSKDCFNEVKTKYTKSMEGQGRYDFFPSKNGWGRA